METMACIGPTTVINLLIGECIVNRECFLALVAHYSVRNPVSKYVQSANFFDYLIFTP